MEINIGWLLTAEMLELIQHGAEYSVHKLTNHITGKGVIAVRELYWANMVV